MTGEKLQVLFIADVSPIRVIGGAERVLYEHMRRLAHGGHAIQCLARAPGREAEAQAQMDGTVVHHFLGASGSSISFFLLSVWNCRKRFQQLRKEQAFDLLNFQQPLSALGVLTARESWKIPKLYTFHSLWFREYEIRVTRNGRPTDFRGRLPSWLGVRLNTGLRRIIERICLKASDRILVLSEFSREQLLRYHRVPASKISLIPGGVDTSRFIPRSDPERQAIRRRLVVPEGASLLLTVRNLQPRMGLENLIQAMVKVVAQRREVYLILGGAGPLEKELRALAARLALDPYLRFEGFIPEARLPEYYQAADFFLLPTRCMEGFGMVTVEALACVVHPCWVRRSVGR
ncbi:MAG: glycosyltransferase family 4 protein [Candidatus Tectomicrobia bacterium]|uniref:Glycosyltransferase family 4 protein n=1 Tax=Tectimicrobiota bacterium TaxID=2528274 RepID=A0A932CQG8_UNCTE|nr:glycosyltransferase family 4 protein [Candidatus Tectomicrobia bacterium]